MDGPVTGFLCEEQILGKILIFSSLLEVSYAYQILLEVVRVKNWYVLNGNNNPSSSISTNLHKISYHLKHSPSGAGRVQIELHICRQMNSSYQHSLRLQPDPSIETVHLEMVQNQFQTPVQYHQPLGFESLHLADMLRLH